MRLLDTHNLVSSEERKKLNEKIDAGLFALAQEPAQGGNPFYYSWLMTKEHLLTKKIGDFDILYAATDGKQYFWNPEFLDRLPLNEVHILMEHETIHIVCDHPGRQGDKIPELWRLCIDFVDWGLMLHDWTKTDRGRKLRYPIHPGTCTFGNDRPPHHLSIAEYKKILKGELKPPTTTCIFADITAANRTPEDIYAELLPYYKPKSKKQSPSALKSDENEDGSSGKSPGPGPDEINGSFDDHLDGGMSNQELVDELMLAQDRAESMHPGSTPSYITELLGELTDPTTNLSDYIRASSLRRIKGGHKNRWKRPRRRSWSIGQYLPTHITQQEHVNWVCLLDTSGSMSQQSITEGLSQLKSISAEFNGIVVPCDSHVHWDEATEVNNIEDLQQTKIIGRGGTTYNDFFVELPERLGTNFDVVIVITDGLVSVGQELNPEIPTLWVLAPSLRQSKFEPPFGDVIKLCQSKT